MYRVILLLNNLDLNFIDSATQKIEHERNAQSLAKYWIQTYSKKVNKKHDKRMQTVDPFNLNTYMYELE